MTSVKGSYTYYVHFEGGWRVRQKWDVIGRRGYGGVASVLDVQSFFLFKKIGVAPNINILLTRNLPIDCGVRQWSHPLMIPWHCLWAKSNNRTLGQFECDVTCLLLFWFRSFTCTVHLLSHGLFENVEESSFKTWRPR